MMSSTAATVKDYVYSMLMATKDGLLQKDLIREYETLVGEPLESQWKKLGFANLLDMMVTFDDKIEFFNDSHGQILYKAIIGKSKSAHIGIMTRGQKENDTKRSKEAKEALRKAQKLNKLSRATTASVRNDIIKILQKFPKGVDIDEIPNLHLVKFGRNLEFNTFGFVSVEDLLKNMSEAVVLSNFKDKKCARIKPSYAEKQGMETANSSFSSSNSSTFKDAFNINSKLRDNLRQLVQDFPDGLPIIILSREFQQKFGHKFDVENFGCSNIVEFCSGMPSIFKISDAGNGNMKLYPIEANIHDGEMKTKNATVPEKIQDNVEILLKQHPDGIQKEKFIREYSRRFGSTINVMLYGFSNLSEFLTAIPFIRIETRSGKPVITMLAPDPFESEAEVDKMQNLNTSLQIHRMISVQKLNVPEIDGEIDIHIGEVDHPEKFWIQLRSEASKLIKLMHEIHIFYSSTVNYNKYKMAGYEVIVGRYCACLYEQKWHRATITKILDINKVKVFYIDYGTTATVNTSGLCHLQGSFDSLPAQAIQSRCSGIIPKGGVWTLNANMAFGDMAFNAHAFFAVTCGVRKTLSEESLSLTLIDTVTNDLPEGININQRLVELGYALVNPNAFEQDSYNFTNDLGAPVGKSFMRIAPLRRPNAPIVGPWHSTSIDYSSNESEKSLSVSSVPGIPVGNLDLLPNLPSNNNSMNTKARPANPDLVPLGIGSGTSSISASSSVRPDFEYCDEIRTVILPPSFELHVFVSNKKGFLLSSEISQLCPKFKGRDILAKMIELKKLKFNKSVVLRDEKNLYEEALIENVPGFPCPDGEYPDEVTLYHLEDLPAILQTVASDNDRNVIEKAKQIVKEFC